MKDFSRKVVFTFHELNYSTAATRAATGTIEVPADARFIGILEDKTDTNIARAIFVQEDQPEGFNEAITEYNSTINTLIEQASEALQRPPMSLTDEDLEEYLAGETVQVQGVAPVDFGLSEELIKELQTNDD